MEWIVPVLVIIVLLGIYLSWTARRIDRLHWRVEASQAVLDAQLLRRSGAALDLAGGGLLDPASAVLIADAASRARTVEESGREQAESELTEALGAALADPEHTGSMRSHSGADAALDELSAACRRVGHARRFHNDTVRATRRLRRKALVRWLGLAGRAPWPETVEFDDEIPRGLAT
ncbi:MAG TPA: NUDIX hydrolase [Jiangellaceae bacterium]|nr:NUDIX hydrolase [Jiangellaceae bacterium]